MTPGDKPWCMLDLQKDKSLSLLLAAMLQHLQGNSELQLLRLLSLAAGVLAPGP